jgi:hypothetical protein
LPQGALSQTRDHVYGFRLREHFGLPLMVGGGRWPHEANAPLHTTVTADSAYESRRDPAVRGSKTIPACAGSSGPRHMGSTRRRDHPRVRGEQGFDRLTQQFERGPSPRARGAEEVRHVREEVLGTIPACAGSRSEAPRAMPNAWDHPRVRGEQFVVEISAPVVEGPSPRARGAGELRLVRVVPGGTIPACAGSSSAQTSPRPPSRDHPRVRGEQRARSRNSSRPPGPSPRARGAESMTCGSIGGRHHSRALSRKRPYRPSRPFRSPKAPGWAGRPSPAHLVLPRGLPPSAGAIRPFIRQQSTSSPTHRVPEPGRPRRSQTRRAAGFRPVRFRQCR